MTDHETVRAAAICPVCGARNELTAAMLPSGSVVACSHCGTPLGTWGSLVPAPRKGLAEESGRFDAAPS